MDKAVVLLSGGLDSSTLMYLLSQDHSVWPLSVNYGQRYKSELEAAGRILSELDIAEREKVVVLPRWIVSGSTLLGDKELPENLYAAQSLKATIVPNRNMILLSLAVGYAVSIGAKVVAYAAHAGDHAKFPDCRPEFFESCSRTAWLGTGEKVSIEAPFIYMSKAEIVKVGARLGVPYGLTYSCYNGREKHCGKCGTCSERKEAFELAGVKDPTVYEE